VTGAAWGVRSRWNSRKTVLWCSHYARAAPNAFTYQMLEEGVIFELLHESFLKNGERQVKLGCVWDS